MTTKHQSPSVRWDELKGATLIGVGADPGIRHFALAAVAVEGVPKGKALQRVYELSKHWRIVGLHMVRVDEDEGGYGRERPVVAMCQALPNAMACFLEAAWATVQVDAKHTPFPPMSVAIEGQHVSAGTTPDPRRILDLANVAGAALAAPYPKAVVLRPLPQEWKGEQPKLQNQQATWRKFGIKCVSSGGKEPYAIPQGMGKTPFLKTDWKDLGDALGLAVFAIETTWPF